MSGSYAPPKGVLFVEPYTKPLVSGSPQPLSYRYFFVSGTTNPATVYQDGYLQNPYTLGSPITADANGNFAPIYLDPSVRYRMQLYNKGGTLLLDQDPIAEVVPLIAPSVLATAITTSSITLASTGLTFTPLLPGVYAYEAYLEVISSAASPTVDLEVSYSGTLASPGVDRYAYLAGGIAVSHQALGSSVAVALTTSTRAGIWIRGSIDTTAVGTLTISWASSSASNTIQMNAGSCLVVQPVMIPSPLGVDTTGTGVLFKEPQSKPLAPSPSTLVQPGCYRQFFYSGTDYGAVAPVYSDAGLTKQLSQIPGQDQPSCTADGDGRFNAIYLDPSIKYAMQLYAVSGSANNLTSTLLEEIDPYVPRPFEIIPAVKLAPTIRSFGAALAADPGLQITLNPGVYLIESFLEFVPSAAGVSVTAELNTISGSGTIVTTNTATTHVLECVTAASHTATETFGTSFTFALGSANTLQKFVTRGVITITGSSVTLAVSWNPSAGSAGNALALSSGSTLVAKQIAPAASFARGTLLSDVQYTPLNPGNNASLPNATLQFWLSRTSGQLQFPATVYQDGFLQTPYGSNEVTANASGQFPAIYLLPQTPLRVQLFDQYGHLLLDVDPYVPNGRFQAMVFVPTSPTDEQASNTTLTIDPNLVVTLPCAGTYRYELYGEYILSSSAGTNPNLNFGMFLEGGGSASELYNILAANGGLIKDIPFLSGSGYGLTQTLQNNSLLENYTFNADYFGEPGGAGGTLDANSAAYSVTGVTDYPITQSATVSTPLKITGIVTVTAPCTLALAWCQNVSSAVDLILLPGSYLKVEGQDPTITATIVTGATGGAISALNAVISPATYTAGTDSTSFTTGSFGVTVTGGSGNYSYAWALSNQSDGSGSANSPTSSATTVAITGMTPSDNYTGTLTCTITDTGTGAQAQVSASLTVTCNATLTASITVTAGSLTPTTSSSSDANFVTVEGVGSGGGGTYTYAWSWSSGGANLTINSPSSQTTTVSASGMSSGNQYTGTLQCKITDQYNSTATATKSVDVTCQLYDGTVTVGDGVNASKTYTGYSNATGNLPLSIGSLSPGTDSNGHTVSGICLVKGVSVNEFTLQISATLTQSYFGTLTVNGVQFTSSSATFTASGGFSFWVWSNPASTPWPSGSGDAGDQFTVTF